MPNSLGSLYLAPLIFLVSLAVVQSVSTVLTCGFPHCVLCPCLASNRLAAGHRDCSVKQVFQSGVHLAHRVLCSRYVLMEYTKHERQSVATFPNTERVVENTTCSGAFLTNFKVLGMW